MGAGPSPVPHPHLAVDDAAAAVSCDDCAVRIPIRFGRLRPLFVVLGLPPSRSYVEIDGDTVRVRMSWGFASAFPRSSVRRAVRRDDAPWSIGVHGFRGRWIVNGAAGPLVELALDPPAAARTMVFRLRVHALAVSVDDPEGLIALLRET